MGSTVAAQPNRGFCIGLGIFQTLIGLSAVAGGLGLTLDPSGASLGMPLEMLQRSPFPHFLVPGLFLLLVNGVGTLVGAGFSFRRHPFAGPLAAMLGAIMVAWIVLQVMWIGYGSWLQAFYVVVGLVELALGLWLRQRMRQHA